MLPAVHRLRRSADFAVTVRSGSRSGRGSLVVHLSYPSATSSEPVIPAAAAPVKAGFVVSRAVGGAVLRNKVKRRLRNLLAERLGDLPAGCTLVVRALPKAGRTPYPQLGKDLDAALAAASRNNPPRPRG